MVHFLILFVLIYYIWEGLIRRQVRFLLLYEGFVGGRAELTDRSTWSSSTISHPELCRGPSCFVRLLSAPQSSSEWLWLPQSFSLLHWDVISFLFLAFFFPSSWICNHSFFLLFINSSNYKEDSFCLHLRKDIIIFFNACNFIESLQIYFTFYH